MTNTKALNYKQIIEIISTIDSLEAFNTACGEIDISFQADKISWKDHEQLYKLVSRFYKLVAE